MDLSFLSLELVCFDFHLDLFQFLSGNEIETKITEIKTSMFKALMPVNIYFSRYLSAHEPWRCRGVGLFPQQFEASEKMRGGMALLNLLYWGVFCANFHYDNQKFLHYNCTHNFDTIKWNRCQVLLR